MPQLPGVRHPGKSPTTPAAFRKAAERGLRRANPGAAGATITWLRCERVVWPGDKSKGFSGTMLVEAPGYAPARMLATLGQGSLTVR